MLGTAITRVGDQNFKILSCQHIDFSKGFDDFSKEIFIKKLVEPLIQENHDKLFIQNIESKINHFLSNILTHPCGISNVDLKSNNKNNTKIYKLLFHKLEQVLFVFLVHSLSDSDMSEIEKNTESKTYFTGDMSDMTKTKKDFH